MKACSKCNLEQPLKNFHKDKWAQCGVRSDCKSCRLPNEAKRSREPEVIARRNDRVAKYRGLGLCVCGQPRIIGRRQCQRCLDYHRKHAKEWRNDNIEKAREIRVRSQNKPEIKLRTSKRRRQRVKDNPDKARAISSTNNQRRRARKQLTPGTITSGEWKTLCDKFNNKCLRCSKPEVTLDHIVPLVKGGSHTIDNAQPLCMSCNSSKQTKVYNHRPDHANLTRLWQDFRYCNPTFQELIQMKAPLAA